MKDLTAEALLASLGIPATKKAKSADLGTDININKDSAEVYYNYNSSSSYSYSDSTLQQSIEPSVLSESVIATSSPLSSGASHPGVKAEEKKTEKTESPRKNIPRKVSNQDYYVQIRMSVNEIRRGKRTDRLNAYLSVREENDKKFSIFLRTNMTTSNDETFRHLKSHDNYMLIDALNEIKLNCPPEAKFFSGTLKYNPRKFKIEAEHKYAIKSAVIGVYDYGDRMTAILFMMNEYYVIELDDDLTEKQENIFNYTGLYQREEMEGE
jgi:hypothetical protein